MVKVKTFTTSLRIFHVKDELENLDKTVNQFLAENKIATVSSVSDSCTTDNTGATIGLVRVLAYESP